MYDIFHEWGGDLSVGSGGDLAISSGANAISQRVSRRLLTNAGDYLWNLNYGAGLAQFIGTPASPIDIEAIVATQLELEVAVPPTPAPQVNVRIADAGNGYVVATVTYADPSSNEPVQLRVSAG